MKSSFTASSFQSASQRGKVSSLAASVTAAASVSEFLRSADPWQGFDSEYAAAMLVYTDLAAGLIKVDYVTVHCGGSPVSAWKKKDKLLRRGRRAPLCRPGRRI